MESHGRKQQAYAWGWLLYIGLFCSAAEQCRHALAVDADTLFLCHFDGTAQADFALGSPHPLGVAAFTEGRFGQALCAPRGLIPFVESVAPITTGVQYESAGNISLREGTLELWVRVFSPLLETTESSPKLRYLLSSGRYVEGNYGFALVLSHFAGKPGEPYTLVWTRQNGPAKEKTWTISCQPAWRPGEWHHVAVTYSAQEDRLFVDGRLIGQTKTGAAMELIGERFAVGANIYRGYVADAAIDELRISARARWANDFSVPESPYN